MLILVGVIVLRSVAWFALLTFVPLWVVSQGGTERWKSGSSRSC